MLIKKLLKFFKNTKISKNTNIHRFTLKQILLNCVIMSDMLEIWSRAATGLVCASIFYFGFIKDAISNWA